MLFFSPALKSNSGSFTLMSKTGSKAYYPFHSTVFMSRKNLTVNSQLKLCFVFPLFYFLRACLSIHTKVVRFRHV